MSRVYFNGENFAILNKDSERGGLLLIGRSLYDQEAERKIFYYDTPLFQFIRENGYTEIARI